MQVHKTMGDVIFCLLVYCEAVGAKWLKPGIVRHHHCYG